MLGKARRMIVTHLHDRRIPAADGRTHLRILQAPPIPISCGEGGSLLASQSYARKKSAPGRGIRRHAAWDPLVGQGLHINSCVIASIRLLSI